MTLRCKYCDSERKSANSLRNHERLCKSNPDHQTTFFGNPDNVEILKELKAKIGYKNGFTKARTLGKEWVVSAETRAKLSASGKGRRHTDDVKLQISEKMKKAHAEGRAHNIGASRWNNEPSYPEKFFIEVIKNEIKDKDYVREMAFGKFSIDFAWPHKKLAIEIDGEQHERFEDQKRRDIEKDELLRAAGWKVLRIKWKEMFADTKYWIHAAKEFVD